tara:strand:- start:3383 stop:4594 length:1212 start_codon:yes stop_codon:yes gene_type:complete
MTDLNNFPRVPYGSTVHGDDEINAVVNVLKTTTQMSKNVREFEQKVSALFEKEHGIMVNSGTSALYLAVEAMDMPAGSEVITPALTFATTVGCLVKNNLIPVFIDVKPDTYCIDERLIEEKISEKTVAICAPDLMGNICEWDMIKKIADRYNLKILHDSADTLGATLDGVKVGSFSDVSITSFYGSHIINGAGNGGMIATSNTAWAEKIKLLRSWGRSSSLFVESEKIENRFNVNLEGIQYDAKFVFEEIGYQLEPSEISAAFALVQLENLKKNMTCRQDHFKSHSSFFGKFSEYFILPNENPRADTCWLAYPLLLSDSAPFDRTEMQIFLEKRNIQTRVVFTGNILRQPGFRNIDCIGEADDFVNADNVMKNGILLACHHGLTQDQIDHLYESIELFISEKC